MANNGQLDELEALEAIYCDREGVQFGKYVDCNISQGFSATLEIAVTAEFDESTDRCLPNGCKMDEMQPLSLLVSLPPSYLCAEADEFVAPGFEISAPWLLPSQAELLRTELDKLTSEHVGAPILFLWLEWLRTETLTMLAKHECSPSSQLEPIHCEGLACAEADQVGPGEQSTAFCSEQQDMDVAVYSIGGTPRTVHLALGATVADLLSGLAKIMKKECGQKPPMMAILRSDNEGVRILGFSEKISLTDCVQYQWATVAEEDQLVNKVRMFFHAVASEANHPNANSHKKEETEDKLCSALRSQLDTQEQEIHCEATRSPIQWHVPMKWAFTRKHGEKLTKRFSLEGVPGNLLIDYYPKGVSTSSAGQCAVFVRSEAEVGMRCTVRVGQTTRSLSGDGAHEWKAGQSWGFTDFCDCCYHEEEVLLEVSVSTIYFAHEVDESKKSGLRGGVPKITHTWEIDFAECTPCPRGVSLRSQPFKLPGCDHTLRIIYFPQGELGTEKRSSSQCSAYVKSDPPCNNMIKLNVNGCRKAVSCGLQCKDGANFARGAQLRKHVVTAELCDDNEPRPSQHVASRNASMDVLKTAPANTSAVKKGSDFKRRLERKTGKRSE